MYDLNPIESFDIFLWIEASEHTYTPPYYISTQCYRMVNLWHWKKQKTIGIFGHFYYLSRTIVKNSQSWWFWLQKSSKFEEKFKIQWFFLCAENWPSCSTVQKEVFITVKLNYHIIGKFQKMLKKRAWRIFRPIHIVFSVVNFFYVFIKYQLLLHDNFND